MRMQGVQVPQVLGEGPLARLLLASQVLLESVHCALQLSDQLLPHELAGGDLDRLR